MVLNCNEINNNIKDIVDHRFECLTPRFNLTYVKQYGE